MQRIRLLGYTAHYAVSFSICALQADVGNKDEISLTYFHFLLFGSIQTWLPVCYDISLDCRGWCGSQICRIHSSSPMIWKLMFVSLCCKLSKYWRREKKLFEVSSGRGCTDVSFPDIFTVLAVLPYCGHGQNMTSLSKPEQTWQPGYVTSSKMDYKLEDEFALHSVNNSAACFSKKFKSPLYLKTNIREER